MSDGVILGSTVALFSAAVMIPAAYRSARYRYRLHYLVGKADAHIKASEWAKAHALLEKALCGNEGLKAPVAERNHRFRVEYKLVQVEIRLKRFTEALEHIDAMSRLYNAEEIVGVRASMAYLRSIVAEGMGDVDAARLYRATVTNLSLQFKSAGMLSHLETQDLRLCLRKILEAAQDHRPAEALALARIVIEGKGLSQHSWINLMCAMGQFEQALGRLEAARSCLEAAAKSASIEDVNVRTRTGMVLANVAALTGDWGASDRHWAEVEATLSSCNYDIKFSGFVYRFQIAWRRGDYATAERAITELAPLLPELTGSTAQRFQRMDYFNRLCLATLRRDRGADLDEAKRLIATGKADPDLAVHSPIFLKAYELLLWALQGDNLEFRSGLENIESEIRGFLAERLPEDAATLREDYSILVEACLAMQAFDAAERYITRLAEFEVYPLDVPRLAVWRGRCALGRGNRDAARVAFRDALTVGFESPATREAREYLDKLPLDVDLPDLSA